MAAIQHLVRVLPRAVAVVALVRVGVRMGVRALLVSRVALVAAEQAKPPADLAAQELLAKDLQAVMPRGVTPVAEVVAVVAPVPQVRMVSAVPRRVATVA
jgi:hypothetical protein